MISLLGGVGVVTGAIWACSQQLARERRHIRQLYALAGVLETMERELRLNAPPMETLLLMACEGADFCLRRLLCSISVVSLENASFSSQWKNMARNNTLQLSEAERRVLERPGNVLGRCGIEGQCACLADVAASLRRFTGQREAALKEQRRLWYTLSLSAALLVVVLLI
jgi:stage III sporulation protein AB